MDVQHEIRLGLLSVSAHLFGQKRCVWVAWLLGGLGLVGLGLAGLGLFGFGIGFVCLFRGTVFTVLCRS